MDKKRILIVTQELDPYLEGTYMGKIVRELIGESQKNNMDVRILMPRYGSINERRHRLHEVVRLSGINIIIDDDDYPLIIKVASLPGVRLQVYFLDNEDFFKRKAMHHNEDGELFDDNAARMVFFCRGVIETVKKFGWPPDIVHCNGWMTSLIPMFIKKAYHKDPMFEKSKVVYSAYDNEFEGILPTDFHNKANINRIEDADLEPYKTATNNELNLGALHYSDASIVASAGVDKEILENIESSEKPNLDFPGEEEFLDAYMNFFNSLVEEEEPQEEENS